MIYNAKWIAKNRIIIYGKDSYNDLRYIFNSVSNNIQEENKYSIKYLVSKDNESPWEYFIFTGEINDQKNNAIKMILEEHYNSENLVKVNEDIKNIIKEYEKDQKKNYQINRKQIKINDNYSNNYNLNKIISEIISKNRNFFDVLVYLLENYQMKIQN